MPSLLTYLLADRVAIVVALTLIPAQLALWWYWIRRTRVPLRKGTAALTIATSRVGSAGGARDILRAAGVPAELSHAVRIAYPEDERCEALAVRAALDPERLLPRSYNFRLDAAAPGIFTAAGILGTFLGLVIAFVRLDFGDAAGSIQPLIGGMTISFLNSLVGVFLSGLWTVRARLARHEFDVAATELAAALEARFPRPLHGTLLLGALDHIRREITSTGGHLRASMQAVVDQTQAASVARRSASERLELRLGELAQATRGASSELLEALAPRLEETFRTLVDLPFEQLEGSVEKFRGVAEEIAKCHERALEAFGASVRALGAAQEGLEQVVGSARESVEAFETGVVDLRAATGSVGEVVEHGRRAAEVIGEAAAALDGAGEQHGRLAIALTESVRELHGAAGVLDQSGTRFEAGAQRMEEAAAQIRQLGTEAAEKSVEAVHERLEQSVARMADALREFGDRNVAAYSESSTRIIEELDERVTDLTDRLSAELQTLATRLPDSAAEITRAAERLRQRLGTAVDELVQATHSLEVALNQTLTARHEEFDGLVAQAVDHFSGTLLTWDGKITELGTAGSELRAGVAELRVGATDLRANVGAALDDVRGSARSVADAAQMTAGAIREAVHDGAMVMRDAARAIEEGAQEAAAAIAEARRAHSPLLPGVAIDTMPSTNGSSPRGPA